MRPDFLTRAPPATLPETRQTRDNAICALRLLSMQEQRIHERAPIPPPLPRDKHPARDLVLRRLRIIKPVARTKLPRSARNKIRQGSSQDSDQMIRHSL